MENYSRSKYSPESQQDHLASPNSIQIDVPDKCPHGDDDSPFFDIDFTLPLYCEGPLKDNRSPWTDKDSEEEEFNFSISSSIQPIPNQSISPADNFLYKGQLLPLHVPPSVETVRKIEVDDEKGSLHCAHVNHNGIKTQLPTLLKTASKLKISLIGLKNSAKVPMNLQAEYGSGMDSLVQKQKKIISVKFKVVEVPLFSRLTRDNSRGFKRNESSSDFQKKSDSAGDIGEYKSNERIKKRVKEIVHKYMKMIKPLYVKISQRYNEKTGHADLEKYGVTSEARNNQFSGSQRSLQNELSFSGNLRTVYKHLCERNSSSNVNPALPNNFSESTMMELQSAIQGAIAHCKQSNYTDAVAADS